MPGITLMDLPRHPSAPLLGIVVLELLEVLQEYDGYSLSHRHPTLVIPEKYRSLLKESNTRNVVSAVLFVAGIVTMV